MAKNNKKIIFLSFSLTLGLGLFFLIFSLPLVKAATVSVTAQVPLCGNNILDSGEQCEVDTDCASGNYCSACACVSSCFLGGTKITLANGQAKPIEEIEIGDLVLSYDEVWDKLEPAAVLQTLKHQSDKYLFVNNQFKITPSHPLFINGEWREAKNLKKGDWLFRQDKKKVLIFSIETKKGNFSVYNLAVDKNHNYFAAGYLAHNKGGCVAGTTSCSWGACVSGTQTGLCSNGCGSWTSSQACAAIVCGNGVKEAGEWCDDGNLAAGDGCSAICQLETGCGNGVLDSGEECDDGDTDSGDCCSSVCKKELIISSISESAITNTSAIINWQTLCQSSQSLLEWGLTADASDGSVSGLAGTNYRYAINNLLPNKVYYYRIIASTAGLQTVRTGSFQTLGGVENCNNGLDDDYDGFCDYPASVCSDGSVAGDPECGCLPDFICRPGLCQPDNTWTVACADKKIPKCRPDYQYQENCAVCPGVFCGPCQELDKNACVCKNTANCCGNNLCEPPAEDPYNCPADCPVECLSDWQCGAWQPEVCPESKIQMRECFDKNACAAPINEPPSQQSCGEVCPGLSCGGTCQKINIQNCACEEYVPCCGNGICENSENFEQCPADCIKICLPDWSCEGWSGCDNGVQTRHCFDLNKCDLNIDRPPEERGCLGTCEAACSTCQNLDKGNCRCLPQSPCCGNRICETEETNWSCPIDCAVPPQVRLTLTQCLDGVDNDRDGFVDYPADSGCQSPADNSEMTFLEMIQKAGEFIRDKIWDNPQVQAANKKVIAPALIAAVAVSTASTFSFLNFLSYLRFLFTQPVYVIGRRKRYKWGVVYNALTKQPVDLAIIRFYEKTANRLIQSRVTDRLGRYLWLAEPGRYYITATKPKFNFPTFYLKDKREDVKYLDIYHGETIEVKESGASVALNIPLDPTEDTRPVSKIIFQHYLRRIQYLVAFSAIPLAVVSFLVSPGLFTFTLLIFHWLLYALFRRLGYEKPPKNWGMIYDQDDRKPLRQAITRIYDKQYHKLLETRLTDSRGRYSFLVNNNLYYLTAEKSGYNPYKSQDIDLINKDREAIVNMDIALAKALAAAGLAPAAPSSQTSPVAPEPTPPVVSPTPPAMPSAPAQTSAWPPTQPTPAAAPKADEMAVVSPDQTAGVFRQSLEQRLKNKEVKADQGKPDKEKSIFG